MEDMPALSRPCRVLVTGATGFVGGRLTGVLLQQGHTIRALVRDRSRLRAGPRLEVIEGDLTDPHSLVGIENDIDIVIHCAGQPGKWGVSEQTIYDVNLQGSINLVERISGQPSIRFIHLSAGGVTGPVPSGSADESFDCKPSNPYEKSKYLAELEVLQRSRENGIPAVVVRPTFTYGPEDLHKLTLFRAIKRGRYALIGHGVSVNHPVYIDDLIAGILKAVNRGRDGEVYILGGERPVTKNELAQTIAAALAVNPPEMSIPPFLAHMAASVLEPAARILGFEPIVTHSRVVMAADNFGYSINKAREELGYRPAVNLQQGVAATIAYYREKGLL